MATVAQAPDPKPQTPYFLRPCAEARVCRSDPGAEEDLGKPGPPKKGPQ